MAAHSLGCHNPRGGGDDWHLVSSCCQAAVTHLPRHRMALQQRTVQPNISGAEVKKSEI